jgi:GxxExxY protein
MQASRNPIGKVQKKVHTLIPAETERIGKVILDAAFKVHTALGPGLLESVYETACAYEVRKSGLMVATQVELPISYDGQQLDSGFRIDMLVGKRVIAEFKSVEVMNPVFAAQLMTYLRLSGVRLGFLINFNVPHLRDGIKRIVN